MEEVTRSASVPVEMRNCATCGSEVAHADTYRTETYGRVCETCLHEQFTCCDRCEGYFLTSHREWTGGDDGYCRDCYEYVREDDDEYADLPERNYFDGNSLKFQSADKGSIITSTRLFSAEVECYYPSMSDMNIVASQLPREFGIASDGSLNDNGVELQTPKLKGKRGQAAIEDMCNILNAHDFSVDRSAGLHIHLDGRGMIPKNKTTKLPSALRDFMLFHLTFESVMRSFLPSERLNNNYCRQLSKNFTPDMFENIASLRAFEKTFYRQDNVRDIDRYKADKHASIRYYGINVHCLLGQGHLEVRYHSGTTNAKKILYWIALHQRIMDAAVAGALMRDYSCIKAEASQGLKTEAFFKILALPLEVETYFRARQEKFGRVIGSTDEEADMTNNDVTACVAS